MKNAGNIYKVIAFLMGVWVTVLTFVTMISCWGGWGIAYSIVLWPIAVVSHPLIAALTYGDASFLWGYLTLAFMFMTWIMSDEEWLERHTNWAVIITWIFLYPMFFFPFPTSSLPEWGYLIVWVVAAILVFVITGIALRYKDRSLGWLALYFFIPLAFLSFIALKNKRQAELLEISDVVPEEGENPITGKPNAGYIPIGSDNLNRLIIDWVIDEFKRDHGINLRSDKTAMLRLKEAAEKAKIELFKIEQTEINLPFITADTSGPKHLNLTLTRFKLNQLLFTKGMRAKRSGGKSRRIIIALAACLLVAFISLGIVLVYNNANRTDASDIPSGTPTYTTSRFVGSVNSNKYHYSWCEWAEQINPSNEIWFSSSADAGSHGYIPCKVCGPP